MKIHINKLLRFRCFIGKLKLLVFAPAFLAVISFGIVKDVQAKTALINVKSMIDIAPAWAGHPAAFDFINISNKQFVAFYDPFRQLTIASRDISSTNWLFVKLNEFVHPSDSHNYIDIAIDGEGFLHLSANMHVDHLNYWRATNTFDITAFQRLDYMTGNEEDRCTYPRFFYDENGNLLFKYRYGSSGSGNEIINIYNTATKTWKRNNEAQTKSPVTLDDSTPLIDGEGLMNAYQAGPVRRGDFYHLAWVWRDTPDCNSNHDIQYARSRDLIDWEDSYGNAINLPITIRNAEMIDPIKIYGGLLNSLRIGFDSQGRIILNYFKFDQNGNTQLYAARRETSGWKIYQITDWTNRWDFHGGGSINNMIVNGGVNYNSRFGLLASFRNRYIYDDYDNYSYILDETTLKPKYAPIPKYPEEITEIQSEVDGMQVNLCGRGYYMLRWETFHNQRDMGDTSDAPTNQMLKMLEIEWNTVQNIDTEPFIPTSDINDSYKKYFNKFDFEQSDSVLLSEAKAAVSNHNYKLAVTKVRQFFAGESYHFNSSFNENTVTDYLCHTFAFNGVERTLFFNINIWMPNSENIPLILTNWNLVNSLTLETEAITSNELAALSPIGVKLTNWYSNLNTLPNLSNFALAYYHSKDTKYARMYIHDLEDWLCDNPLPETSVNSYANPWSYYIAGKRYKSSLKDFVPLLAGATNCISDDDFFFLINAVQKHQLYFNVISNLVFYDSFDVENGGGDINYQYELRQKGDWAPIEWWSYRNKTTVTNAGTLKGKLHVDSITEGQLFGPQKNFSLNNCSIEYKVFRNIVERYVRICIDYIPQAHIDSETACFFGLNGPENVMFYTKNDNTNSWKNSSYQINKSYDELTNNCHEVKLVLSDTQTAEPKTALFINNKAYPVGINIFTNSGAEVKVYNFTYKHHGNFRPFIGGTNYIHFLHASPKNGLKAQADIDDFKITVPEKSQSFIFQNWTNDATIPMETYNSNILAVNLNGNETLINGVTFSSSSSTENDDWSLYTASGQPLQKYDDASSKIKVSGAATNLMLNFFYRDNDSMALTIKNLIPNEKYRFILYGMGWENGERETYFTTSDGTIITNFNIDEFGMGNGVAITYDYIADSNGIFTISSSPVKQSSWHWYAFMNINMQNIPEPVCLPLLMIYTISHLSKLNL